MKGYTLQIQIKEKKRIKTKLANIGTSTSSIATKFYPDILFIIYTEDSNVDPGHCLTIELPD